MNYLIAGLGNIGAEYADTRHNVGFMTLDAWADDAGVTFQTQRYGEVAELSFKGRKLTLPGENILVICDDRNLPFGTLRMRKKGSDGGHNGLKNIQELLGTQDYPRIRIGIGNNFQKGGQVNFVIGSMTDEEKAAMPEICKSVISGIKDFVTIGPDRAMNIFNTVKK